jgi:hypothetical protein
MQHGLTCTDQRCFSKHAVSDWHVLEISGAN